MEKYVKKASSIYYLHHDDIPKIKRYIRKMITKKLRFIEGVEGETEGRPKLTVVFKDKADEAFFILHSSDGIEIT